MESKSQFNRHWTLGKCKFLIRLQELFLTLIKLTVILRALTCFTWIISCIFSYQPCKYYSYRLFIDEQIGSERLCCSLVISPDLCIPHGLVFWTKWWHNPRAVIMWWARTSEVEASTIFYSSIMLKLRQGGGEQLDSIWVLAHITWHGLNNLRLSGTLQQLPWSAYHSCCFP